MKAVVREPLVSRVRRELHPRRLAPNLAAGLTTGCLCAALAVSLGALVYSGDTGGFLANGVGLALISAALVGTVVALLGSLPGTVANVQSAPAAVLAAAAAGVAGAVPAGTRPEDLFLTVAATVGLATLTTALALLALGWLRLGGLARYLPYPVVGGFLAGTGWLLVTGGVGLMAGVQPGWSDLGVLLRETVWPRWVPGLAFGVLILAVTSRVSHHAVWPALLAGAAALFFAVMSVSGASVEEWRARGLLLDAVSDASLLRPVDYAGLGRVAWPVVLGQAAAAATVAFLSVMSVLLNAAGLELATGRKVDLDRELRVAGLGNLLAGLAGGMVGYQLLSFTVFNRQAGADGRLAAMAAVGVVLVTLLFGASLLAFVPTAIVGGLLAYLGLTFLRAWVYDAFFKLPRLEYAVVLLILAAVATLGFVPGVGLGVLAAVVLFAVNYSRTEVVRHALSGASHYSRVRREGRERRSLEAQGHKLLVVQLQGYLFFGSASGLLERVERRLDQPLPVEYVVLDFRRVTGLDATALLSFSRLAALARQRGFWLVLTDLAPPLARQLTHGGVTQGEGGSLRVFATLDQGLEWAEGQLLEALEPGGEPPGLHAGLGALVDDPAALPRLLAHLERLDTSPGQYLIRQGDPPDVLYLLESGQVTARLEEPGQAPVRLETMRGGSVVGELGFYTGGARSASVVVDEAGTVYRLTAGALEEMTRRDPAAAASLHRLIVRLLAGRVTHLLRVVETLQR